MCVWFNNKTEIIVLSSFTDFFWYSRTKNILRPKINFTYNVLCEMIFYSFNVYANLFSDSGNVLKVKFHNSHMVDCENSDVFKEVNLPLIKSL